MSPKNLIAIGLLLFVAASIAVLAVKQLPQGPNAQDESPPVADAVIAYYFHGNMRCPTCQKIESYAHEAIETGFPEQLQSGALKWQVVNYEAPGNERLATEYEIVAPTVVVVKIEGGQEKGSENLMRVWELVGDKSAFCDYVQGRTRTLLEDASS